MIRSARPHPFLLAALLCASAFAGEGPAPAPAPAAAPGSGTAAAAPSGEITDARYLLDLAQVHLNHNSGERAEPLVRAAIANLKETDAPLKTRSATLLARVLEKKNDLAGAAEQYEIVIKSSTEPLEKVNLLLALSKVREGLKQYDKALETLNQAGAVTRNAPANQSMTWMQREVNRRTLEILPKDPERLAAAIAEAEAALAKDPKDRAANERLADIHQTVKPDPLKAIPYVEKMLEANPESTDVLNRLSSLYMQSRQSDKAIEITRKLAKVAPKEHQAQYNFQTAILLIQRGNRDEAVKVMEEYVGDQPVTDRVAMLLGTVYEQCGRMDKAFKTLRTAATLSKHPQEKISLSLRAAEAARRVKDYAGAEETLRTMLKEFKDDKNAQESAKVALAQLYREQGKEKELKFE
ncbi:MAG TPA: tetratricopeptide repeat protein [Planctomycetota bacterium]|nr:tetratricopeptide repeat protein [Planctomycetota bacterium]